MCILQLYVSLFLYEWRMSETNSEKEPATFYGLDHPVGYDERPSIQNPFCWSGQFQHYLVTLVSFGV